MAGLSPDTPLYIIKVKMILVLRFLRFKPLKLLSKERVNIKILKHRLNNLLINVTRDIIL
jgi:hypothetical protein